MSEILAFAESASSDPKLSAEPVSGSETSIRPLMYHHRKLQLRNQAPLKQFQKMTPVKLLMNPLLRQKPFHRKKKRILTRIFHRMISNLLTIPKKIRLPEKRKIPTTTFSIQQRN